MPPITRSSTVTLSRRALLGAGVATGGGAALAGAAAAVAVTGPERSTARADDDVVPWHGAHQAGIDTPLQRYATFATFDLSILTASTLRDLLVDLTATIRALTGGGPPPEMPDRPEGLSTSTDVATGLSPARLTMTVGLGPGVLERYDLADRVPRRLRPLPAFDGDLLDPRCSGGDLLVQICADDPQVVSHAFRTLRGRLPGLATLRWTQHGFVGLPSGGGTPRNLFGHPDGTTNPTPGTDRFDTTVWALPDEPAWFAGGTYLVFRKIRMKTATWDLTPLAEQDAVIGRRRADGAPLTGKAEHDAPDLDATDGSGEPVIAADAHVRRAAGFPMLRRGYSYDYGFTLATAGGQPDPTGGVDDHDHGPDEEPHTHGGHAGLDTGLLFCAYGNDPDHQFVAAQRRLAEQDALNRFIQHTGSAIFAILPGCGPDGYLGDTLV